MSTLPKPEPFSPRPNAVNAYNIILESLHKHNRCHGIKKENPHILLHNDFLKRYQAMLSSVSELKKVLPVETFNRDFGKLEQLKKIISDSMNHLAQQEHQKIMYQMKAQRPTMYQMTHAHYMWNH